MALRRSHLQLLLSFVFFTFAVGLVIGAAYFVMSSDRGTKTTQNKESPTLIKSQVDIVLAAQPILRGDVLAADHLKVAALGGTPPDGAFRSVDPLIGRVALVDMLPGQTILAEAVTEDRSTAGLAGLIPLGMRAVAIRVSDDIAVGNLVRPGDWADLHIVLSNRALAGNPAAGPAPDQSEAHLLLQRVKLLAVGPSLSPVDPPKDGKPAPPRPDPRDVTLAVTPDQASQIALMRGAATYFLALRAPRDEQAVADHTVRMEDLRGPPSATAVPARPPLFAPDVLAGPPLSAGPTVEILKGRTLTVQPLGKGSGP
jgi:pilus assembly protein CpaB